MVFLVYFSFLLLPFVSTLIDLRLAISSPLRTFSLSFQFIFLSPLFLFPGIRTPHLRLLCAACSLFSPTLRTYHQSNTLHPYCYSTCCRRWLATGGAAAIRAMLQTCNQRTTKICNGVRDCRGSDENRSLDQEERPLQVTSIHGLILR